jgi:curved DNA-binding protein CbpA
METRGDHYATLRVSPDADAAALRRAYRQLMRSTHPDVNGATDAADRSSAINAAYACLRDPSARAAYDGQRRAAQRRRRAAATAPSPRPYPTDPRVHSPGPAFDEELAVQGGGPRVAGIAFGLILTIITFAVTSAVDNPPPARAAVAHRDSAMKPASSAPARSLSAPAP